MNQIDSLASAKPTANDKVFHLLPAQDGFIFSDARFPAYIGAWGTGKSFALIQRAMLLSEESPKNLGVIFRKEFTDLRDSTCKDFERYTGIKISSERSVMLPNKSEIMFRHLEEMHGVVQNLNLGWFGIEQSDELPSEEIFNVLRGRLRRDVKRRSGFVIGNTNGHDWQYKLWKAGNGEDKDYQLFEATSFDAEKYLPSDTIADWKKLETSSPKIYRRFVLNSWDESDTSDVVIDPEWIRKCTRIGLNITHPIRRLVSCDVARYGDDKTVAYALENGRVIGSQEWEKKSTMETVGRLMMMAKKNGNIESFAVDEIGVGGGVVDRLQELGAHVIPVNSSEKAEGAGFYNRRAEIYSFGANLFENRLVALPPDARQLIEELSWSKYKQIRSNGVYQVEAKDDIKKRYGRSPDHADALLMGLWATPQAKIYDGFGEPDYANAPMMVSSAVPTRAPSRARRKQ
jgi:hypothetical protein